MHAKNSLPSTATGDTFELLSDSPNKQPKQVVITGTRGREMLTLIVFRKFLGSSGSSNGYDPTSITYSVTPQDQTSATWTTRMSEVSENSEAIKSSSFSLKMLALKTSRIGSCVSLKCSFHELQKVLLQYLENKTCLSEGGQLQVLKTMIQKRGLKHLCPRFVAETLNSPKKTKKKKLKELQVPVL